MTQATLALRTAQQTALTPRLQQSVRLLQLSSNDFAQELEQALATNPFLEVPAVGEPTISIGEQGGWTSTLSGEASILAPSDRAPHDEPQAGGLSDAAGEDPPFDGATSSPADDDRAFGAEPFDFTPFNERSGSLDGEDTDIGSWAEATTTLRAHLHDELVSHRLSSRERAIVELVIEALDDDGYLRQSLDDVADRFPFDPPVDADELAAALDRVQRLGPAGIAARSVAECLGLQLEALAGSRASTACAGTLVLAATIVRDHLPLVASRDWAALRRTLGCSMAEVTAAAELIRSLDPRPASVFCNDVAQAVVPDVIVRRLGNKWHADINPAVVPRLALNRVYAALFRDARGGDRQPLGEQLQEARWLLRNAAQRFVTIRRVARVIVAEQAAFLDYGDIAIKPLLLRQVADRLDLHDSTISRAIGNKFMATPRGVFAFKHFFSRKLATVSGGSCSAASIRAAMRELIDREDPGEPLSDVMIARHLTDQGLCVARRTVTKYRGLLRIPPVEMRRQLEAA